MLPRERVILALNHQATDRIPRDLMAVPEVWDKLLAHFNVSDRETVYQKLDIDMRLVDPFVVKPKEYLPDGTYYDVTGSHRRLIQNEFCTYSEYASFPLAEMETIDGLAGYSRWPSIDDWDFSTLPDQIGDMNQTYYVRYRIGSLFEWAWALRGYEQIMLDMVMDPELVHYIMNRLCDLQCEKIRRGMEAAGDKIDMIHTYDDVATQQSLLISKDMWRTFIMPYHQRMNALIRSYGKKIFYHCCGAVYELIGELAQLPIDVLNPIQPSAKGMSLPRIKKEFGDILCFHGGIDIQQLLPHGTPEQVAEETKEVCRIMGENGGYILCSAHHIQADTPVENILAMYDAARTI